MLARSMAKTGQLYTSPTCSSTLASWHGCVGTLHDEESSLEAPASIGAFLEEEVH
jgi:hypothetical protein